MRVPVVVLKIFPPTSKWIILSSLITRRQPPSLNYMSLLLSYQRQQSRVSAPKYQREYLKNPPTLFELLCKGVFSCPTSSTAEEVQVLSLCNDSVQVPWCLPNDFSSRHTPSLCYLICVEDGCVGGLEEFEPIYYLYDTSYPLSYSTSSSYLLHTTT